MINFINVFTAVKTHCEIIGFNEDEDCFNTIAKSANVPINNLGFYLNVLQNLGLISYSTSDRTIQLTEIGVKQDNLFRSSFSDALPEVA